MKICTEGIMDTKNHQQRNFGTQREVMTTIYKKRVHFIGHIERKDGLEGMGMIGMMNGRRGRRPPKEELYRSFD